MIKQHTIIQSLFLHIFPGIVIAVAYYMAAPLSIKNGFPNDIASDVIDILVLLPMEIGILLYIAKKETGKYNILKLFPWLETSSAKEYFVFLPIMAIWAIVVSNILSPIEVSIRNTIFSFVPAQSLLGNYELSMMSKSKILMTGICGFFADGILAPVVEEFYFRGYLLPRINLSKNKGVILNAVLFSLYHFYSPWQFFSRVLMMIPLYYWVAKKKNIRFSIIAHIIANTFTVVSMTIGAF